MFLSFLKAGNIKIPPTILIVNGIKLNINYCMEEAISSIIKFNDSIPPPAKYQTSPSK